MLSIALQIVMVVSFAALIFAVWCGSKVPRWGVREVIYGWAASIIWPVFWAALMPMYILGQIHRQVKDLPPGTKISNIKIEGP